MAKIITTTGTSLLGNTARNLRKPSAAITDDELHQHMRDFPPYESTAETNSLLKIASPQDDEIVFLYTATYDGKRCATIVQEYLENRSWSVRMRELPIDYDEAKFERHGLRELINILVEEIIQAQRNNQEVIINATGGFKAEIAYTTMVGTIFQVPVKYIYQHFSKPITFPALPITWDTEIMLTYEDFFEWIDSEPHHRIAVEKRLKAVYDRQQVEAFLLPPDSEGYIYLSPAGDILWRRVRQQREEAEIAPDPPVSEVPMKDKISSSLKSVKHHYPKYTLDLAEKLAEIDVVEEITGDYFENTTLARLKGAYADGTVRLLWADDTKATNLKVRTTARGIAQTLRVRDRAIRPIFEKFCQKK